MYFIRESFKALNFIGTGTENGSEEPKNSSEERLHRTDCELAFSLTYNFKLWETEPHFAASAHRIV